MHFIYFISYHSIFLVIFIVGIVITWKTVSKLRDEGLAYRARLPFACYSLRAWICWALQYLVLITWTFYSTQDHKFLSAAISIGVVGNALWAVAILSLYSRRVYRRSFTVTYVIAFSILIGLLILIALVSGIRYQREILDSAPFTMFEWLLCFAIFTAFAFSINELRLSKAFVVAFLIHALSQGLWQLLFSSSSTIRLYLLVVFPIWHIALFLSWRKLTPLFLQRAQSDSKKARPVIKLKAWILTPFRVMVSSSVEDLVPEREAADRAIRELHLDVFIAEQYGSLSETPRNICEQMARHCDIFILIVGQRYGYVFEPDGISATQFEYETARAQSPEKILAYVKKGVTREPRLREFLKVVEDFNFGNFRSSFTSPKELSQQIRVGIMRWLVSRAKQ
jgi:uncharacterized protein DUF4062